MPAENINSVNFATFIQLAQDTEAKNDSGLKKFHGIAYTGGAIGQSWTGSPVIIELDSLKFRQQIPLMVDHNTDSVENRIGELTAKVEGNQIVIDGVIDTNIPLARELAERGRRIAWQLSVGASPGDALELRKGEKMTVNGAEITGPAIICRNYTLHEVSVVSVGADPNTSLSISASIPVSKVQTQNNKEENNMPDNIKANSAPAQNDTAPAANVTAALSDSEKKAIQAAERTRIADIMKLTANHPEIQASAIEQNWTPDQTARKVLETIQAAAPKATVVVNHNEATPAEDATAIKAAVMMTAGVAEKNVIADCGEKAVEASAKLYRDGIGIQELLIRAAKQAGVDAGYKVTMGNVGAVIRAAAASTIDVGGILGGVIDRRLYEGFMSIDQSWREITEIVNVKDFRAVETYQLISGGHFQRVTDAGELKSGSLAHSDVTNQADLFGETLTLTLKDIINDDLNAFSKVPALLGQDAAIAFNEIFWTEFLNNSGFFKADNGNVVSSCAFNLDNLATAVAAFRSLKDAAGRRIGGQPALVLVPTGLEAKAMNVYSSTEIRETTSNKSYGTNNPYTGKFKPVCSPYLDDSDISGYSATSWYLLADPARRAVMQAAFLNGQQTPTIERGTPAFNQLGISFRAYQAFGCVKNIPQAGVRCNA